MIYAGGGVSSGGGVTVANPTATIGLSTVNGSASTAMRSDGAPALDQAIVPTMTGAWTFNNSVTTALAGSLAAPSLVVANASPVIGIFDTDAAAQRGKFVIDGRATDELRISCINDTGSGSSIGLSLSRNSSTTITNVTLGSGASTLTHAGTGIATFVGSVTANTGIGTRKGSVTISATERVKVGGVSYTNFTTTGNTAATETDAFSHSVTAATLGTDGESLEFVAAGTFAATANVDKRIKVVFGSTTVFDTGNLAITAASSWNLKGTIIRTGATAQKVSISLSTSSASLASYSQYTASAETLANALTLKLTVNGTSANDTVGEFYKEQWLPFL